MSSENSRISRLEVSVNQIANLIDLVSKYMDELPNNASQPKEIVKPKKVPSSSRLKRKCMEREDDNGKKEDPEADDTMEESSDDDAPITPKLSSQKNLIVEKYNEDDGGQGAALSPLDDLYFEH